MSCALTRDSSGFGVHLAETALGIGDPHLDEVWTAWIRMNISPGCLYPFRMTAPRLLVIQHDLDDALNELAAPLADAGLTIDHLVHIPLRCP